MAELVTIVFVDKHHEQHTLPHATKLCKSVDTAGYIIDVLTPNLRTQTRLRNLIDQAGDIHEALYLERIDYNEQVPHIRPTP